MWLSLCKIRTGLLFIFYNLIYFLYFFETMKHKLTLEMKKKNAYEYQTARTADIKNHKNVQSKNKKNTQHFHSGVLYKKIILDLYFYRYLRLKLLAWAGSNFFFLKPKISGKSLKDLKDCVQNIIIVIFILFLSFLLEAKKKNKIVKL